MLRIETLKVIDDDLMFGIALICAHNDDDENDDADASC